MTTGSALSFADTYAAIHDGVVGQVVVCDVVRVAGKDALSYLQGQATQDLTGLGTGDVVDSLLLSVQGRTDAYVRVAVLGDEEALVVVAAGYGDVVYERLRRYRIRVKAELTQERWQCATLRGPLAVQVAADFDGVVLPVAWPGVVGVDLLAPGAELPAGVPFGDAAAFEAARIESGEPVMGREVTERTIAEEADLVTRAVSFTKGCYLGQELVARIDSRGNNVPKRLRGVVVAQPAGVVLKDAVDAAPAPAIEPGTVLSIDGRDVGELTSVAWSPRLGTTVGLAYLRRDVVPPAQATLTSAVGEELVADVVELPIFAGS